MVSRGDVTARDFVNRVEPLANLLEVMQHLMSHNGHLKTAIIPVEPDAVFLAPTDFVRDPEAMAARLAVATKRRPTRAGWPRITTKISTWSASCCPSACIRISTTSTAFCRWADDLGDEIGDTAESLRLLAWWRERAAGHVRGRARRIRCSSRCAARSQRYAFRMQPFDDLIQAFEQDQTVTRYRNLGRAVRVLPLFRESGGAAGAGICAAIATRSGRRFPTPPAPRCSSPISGRM